MNHLFLAALLIGQTLAPPSLEVSEVQSVRLTGTHLDTDAQRVAGRVCRRPNRSGLQPSRLEIDRFDASGMLVARSFAILPRLSTRVDQSCGYWQARLAEPAQPGDVVRVCVGGGRGQCLPPHVTNGPEASEKARASK